MILKPHSAGRLRARQPAGSARILPALCAVLLLAPWAISLAGVIVDPSTGVSGELDPYFNAGSSINASNAPVQTMALQSDGKLIIGGEFTSVAGAVRGRLARLNADGSNDRTFMDGLAGFDSKVECVAVQADGKILAGGWFLNVNGVPRARIARLNVDGTLDSTYQNGMAGVSGGSLTAVFALALQPDGKALIGGDFTQVNGVPRWRCARLNVDGSLDPTFTNPAINGLVFCLAVQPNGYVLAGGNFNIVAGTGRTRIARLRPNGALDTGFQAGTGANNNVKSVIVQPDGRILLGGDFTDIGGAPRFKVARLGSDGSVDATFQNPAHISPGAGVTAMALQPNGKVLLGGNIGYYAVGLQWRGGLVRLNADGTRDNSFDQTPGPNNVVDALILEPDGNLLIGGRFTMIDGVPRVHIGRVNGANGSLDSDFENGPPGPNDIVEALAVQSDGRVLIGGGFGYINHSVRNRIARLNFDGSLDTDFQNAMLGANANVFSIAVQFDNKIVIGGNFQAMNGVARERLARLKEDGSLDLTFPNPLLNAPVTSIVVAPGNKLLVGGLFTSVNGVTRNRIARLNPNGTLDLTFSDTTGGANDIVHAIARLPNGKVLIGGRFTSFSGTPRGRIARLDQNGLHDPTFLNGFAGANDAVRWIAVQPDGKILIAGAFTTVNGLARGRVARLNSDGSLDIPFGAGQAGANGEVLSVVPQPNGRVLIAGLFNLVNATPRNFIALLNANGSLNPAIGSGGANGGVYAMTTASQGKVLLGGQFTQVAGQSRDRVARLLGDHPTAISQGDDDGDGVSNFVEYATGGSYGSPGGGPLATAVQNGSQAEYTYTRSIAALGEVQFRVEWSTGLGAATWNAASDAGTVVSDNGTTQQVRVSVPMVPASRMFFRLSVSLAPPRIAQVQPSFVTANQAGGQIYLVGQHFDPALRVRINGQIAGSQSLVAAGVLRVTVPVLAAGIYDIELIDTAGAVVATVQAGLEVAAGPGLRIQGPPGQEGGVGPSLRLSSGEFTYTAEDLRIPGRGFDLVWRRTYRSRLGGAGAAGYGWDFDHNVYVVQAGQNLVLHRGNGRADTFRPQPDGTYACDGLSTVLVRELDGTVKLAENPSGRGYSFYFAGGFEIVLAAGNPSAQGRSFTNIAASPTGPLRIAPTSGPVDGTGPMVARFELPFTTLTPAPGTGGNHFGADDLAVWISSARNTNDYIVYNGHAGLDGGSSGKESAFFLPDYQFPGLRPCDLGGSLAMEWTWFESRATIGLLPWHPGASLTDSMNTALGLTGLLTSGTGGALTRQEMGLTDGVVWQLRPSVSGGSRITDPQWGTFNQRISVGDEPEGLRPSVNLLIGPTGDLNICHPAGSPTSAGEGYIDLNDPDICHTGESPTRSAQSVVATFLPLDGSAVAGKIEHLSNLNGNSLTFSYNPAGRLITITDTLDRAITVAYDAGGLISSVADFTGRQVLYSYYQNGEPGGGAGDLKSVTSPAVTGTPHGNDFPAGKMVTYTYSTGFADAALNHNLLTITVASGQVVLENAYAAKTDANALIFDRVIRQRTPKSANPAQMDSAEISYRRLPPSPGNGYVVVEAIVNDRVGNVSEHDFDSRNRLIVRREYTGRAIPGLPTTSTVNRPTAKLRAYDPDYFETRCQWNADSLPTQITLPNGSSAQFVHELEVNPDAARLSRANLRQIRRLPGPAGGDQTQLVQLFDYTPAVTLSFGPNLKLDRLTRYVDARALATTYRHDTRGNLTQVQAPIAGAVKDLEYNSFGQITAITQPPNDNGYRRRDKFVYHNSGPENGYLSQLIEDFGGQANGLSFCWNVVGLVERVVDSLGNDTLFTYNALGQIVRVQSPEVAPGTRYERLYWYNARNNLVRIDVENRDETGALAANAHFTRLFAHDVMNQLTEITSEQGNANLGNNVLTLADIPAPLRNEFWCDFGPVGYDPNGNPTLFRFGEAAAGIQPDNVVQMVWDERERLFRQISAPGSANQSTTQFDYDLNGNLTSLARGTEAAPRVTQYGNDGFNRCTSITDPMGNVAQYSYDAEANLLNRRIMGELNDVAGSAGNVRLFEEVFTYDALNRLTQRDIAHFDTQTQEPVGDGYSSTVWAYALNSRVRQETNDRGYITTCAQDTASRLRMVTDAGGNSRQFSYDANLQVTGIEDTDISETGGPDQHFVTTLRRDSLGRVISLTDSAGNVSQTGYNSRGLPVLSIDARGNVTRRAFDGLGQLATTTRILTDTGYGSGTAIGTIVTTQSWDHSGRLIAAGDGNGNVTRYAYDDLNRLIIVRRADGTLQQTGTGAVWPLVQASPTLTGFVSGYDVHDNAKTTRDPNGTIVASQFDLSNRLTSLAVTPGAGVSSATTFENYQYDGLSRLVRAQDDDSDATFTHSSVPMLCDDGCMAYLTTGDTLNGLTVSHTYDGPGNNLTTTSPGGPVVTRTFDEVNHPATISADGQSVASFSYVGDRLERIEFGNGMRTNFSYNGFRGAPNVAGDFGVQQPVRATVTRDADNTVLDDLSFKFEPGAVNQ